MLEKLNAVSDRYHELERLMSQPDVAADSKKFTALTREYRSLTEIVTAYRDYVRVRQEKEEADAIRRDSSCDAEMRKLADDEYTELSERGEKLFSELRMLLLPKDERDSRNVIVEIRAGTGGEEAALFAADLYRMYTMYADREGFSTEVVSANETELGGYREITFSVSGEGAFSRFKFESGVHRVQRIPLTESNGRIQTSAVSVAVLAEADEVEVQIRPEDIKFESCKSSGAGGQHINKTESAVRLTHKPTGIVIECGQERSQLQNKEKALTLLRTRLYDMRVREQEKMTASQRRSQIGSGDRSEKIRTYNYPQSRVTDHRINKTIYTLQSFMNGDIGEMISELIAADSAEKLKNELDENRSR